MYSKGHHRVCQQCAVQGREPPHRFQQQLANQGEGQQIQCGRWQEKLPLACHSHWHAHREGRSRYQDNADL